MYHGKMLITMSVSIAVALSALTGCSSKKQVEPPPQQETRRPEPQRPAPPQVEPKKAEPEETVPRDLAFATVYFDFDRSNIRPDQQSVLEQNARMMSRYETVRVRLEGHCDERGTEEYNMALGQRRADSVEQFLIDYGISRNRISTISYGEMRPAAQGQNETAWSRNRRVEIVITGR